LPAVAPTVSISRSSDSAVLTWPHHTANIGGYEVWCSANAYFTPNDLGSDHSVVQPVGANGTYTCTIGSGAADVAFVVLGVDGAKAKSATSNRVGVFNFALTPGTSP